jgi:prophage regulatory protein
MKLIRLPETLARTGLSRTRLYEAVSAGTFPKPAKLGPAKLGSSARAVAWSADEVDAWIEARLAEREAA